MTVPCRYCQQLTDMIRLAENRDETQNARVLNGVLLKHRQEKQAHERRLRCVDNSPH
ncbi:hypothetical protein MMF93_23855 [Streptomyces tubbatahanensis]|uniref:Uncharacterized protein n=1 Tax=Streptomyces tubbatahanensis TaxID=2923272 RepID=A0ABY3XXV0_9ACTN|nr:hypothetical protein [Streptomyces tubbatahanensis]UNS99159.1 hypothetical protein MMF93_23855 [Streptomyces tubbatahanensis]